MDSALFSINNIRMMEVIDINSGMKLGYIRDIKIDCSDYRIVSVIIPVQKSTWFSKFDSMEIPWENVKKIGVDVILVENVLSEVKDE